MISLPWLRLWWVIFNKQIFDGALPPVRIELVDLDYCGETDGSVIRISSRIVSTDRALTTLVHEMVHQFQFSTGKPMDHGDEFESWAGFIEANFNMEIR